MDTNDLYISDYHSMLDDELYHYGIKGMKWGVRRFQRKDGSLTSAGRKRYSDDPELDRNKKDMELAKSRLSVSKKAYSKAYNRYMNVPIAKNRIAYEEALSKFNRDNVVYNKAKLKYDTNKETKRIQEKGITFDKKSKHRLRLEEQYRKMGMSDEQAQAAANNRIRTEKILAASAALTVTACAAYVANKKLRDRIDGVIKAGEKLQRVEMQDTGGKLHDMFYAAQGDRDKTRYKNLLGMARKQQTGHAYLMELQNNRDIKIASKDRAAKVFGDLYKNDPDFRRSIEPKIKRHFGGSNFISDTSNVSDKNIKKMYENFNSNLLHIREAGSGEEKKFYTKLKKAGYGAVQDINDMKYSGYNAKNPLIIFDNSDRNIMVKSFSEITDKNIKTKGTIELLKATGESVAKDFIEKAGPLSAVALTANTVRVYNSDPNDELKERD